MRIDRIGAPMREPAVRNLGAAIPAGPFHAGQRLPERDICELLGAGRTAVYEALRHLEWEGFVETIPGHGPAVSAISEKVAAEVFEARAAIEGPAVELCARRASDETMARLLEAHEHLTQAYRSGDVQAILSAKELYEALFLGTGKDVLQGVRPQAARAGHAFAGGLPVTQASGARSQ